MLAIAESRARLDRKYHRLLPREERLEDGREKLHVGAGDHLVMCTHISIYIYIYREREIYITITITKTINICVWRLAAETRGLQRFSVCSWLRLMMHVCVCVCVLINECCACSNTISISCMISACAMFKTHDMLIYAKRKTGEKNFMSAQEISWQRLKLHAG